MGQLVPGYSTAIEGGRYGALRAAYEDNSDDQ
jgi:hypothetical protein